MTWKRTTLFSLGSARRGRSSGRRVWLVLAAFALVPAGLAALGSFRAGPPPPLRLSRTNVEVEGTRLAFHRAGQGPDVLLIHGGMGTAEDFEPVIGALARGHRVTAVDRPGFGGSSATAEGASVPGNARSLAGLIRALGLVHPVLVAHSYGAGVALRLALDAPELVSGLVLISASAYPSQTAPHITERLLAAPRMGEGLGSLVAGLAPSQIEATLIAAIGPDADKVGKDFISWRVSVWNTPLSLATRSRQQVNSAADLEQAAPRYATLKMPSVVVWCEQDPYEGKSSVQSARLAKELGALEVRLPGCGHYVQYAHPEAVIQAVERLSPSLRRETPAAPGKTGSSSN